MDSVLEFTVTKVWMFSNNCIGKTITAFGLKHKARVVRIEEPNNDSSMIYSVYFKDAKNSAKYTDSVFIEIDLQDSHFMAITYTFHQNKAFHCDMARELRDSLARAIVSSNELYSGITLTRKRKLDAEE